MVAVPDGYEHLRDLPLYGHLATVRPDGTPQVNAMWFHWDGEVLRFTHTTKRQKYRNIQHEPRVAFSIHDPENPYRSIEVRGTVESVEQDDTEASFYRSLQERYGNVYPITDADRRVIITVRPTTFVTK